MRHAYSMLDLTLACGDMDLTTPLKDGTVSPKGINLTTLNYSSATRHWRCLRHGEFDACELSLSSYLASRTDPEKYPYTAIPVFPHRLFRHGYMFRNARTAVTDPGDLAGARVGLRNWQTTSGVWMRGIAREHYGLDLTEVTWFVDDTEDVAVDVPDKYDLRQTPQGRNIEDMIVANDLDGAFYPVLLNSVTDPDGGAERIFPDYIDEERDYYQETVIFPVMHAVAIRDDLLERYPWVAVNLFKAFVEARDHALERAEDPRASTLLWARHHLERQRDIVGALPWEYGPSKGNVRAVNKLQEYAKRQGLIPRRYDLEELFVETTLDTELQEKGYPSGAHRER